MEQVTLLNGIGFWVFAVVMIAGALGVVLHRSIVYNAMFLLLTFLSIAAVFVLLNAPFLAAAQILVYGVGLTIVLIFGIMLTGDQPIIDPVGEERSRSLSIIPGGLAVLFAAFLLFALLNPDFQTHTVNGLFNNKVLDVSPRSSFADLPAGAQAIAADGGITRIAELLFTTYLIPFELASILLLLAMVGAIILSKRFLPEEESEIEMNGLQDNRDVMAARKREDDFAHVSGVKKKPTGVI